MKLPMLAAACATLLGLTACATNGNLRDSDKLALYQSHAGEPVGSFNFFGRLNGWTPLGDSALVVWTKPSEAWLLDLSGPCQDIEYTPAIGLTSNHHPSELGIFVHQLWQSGQIKQPPLFHVCAPINQKHICYINKYSNCAFF